MFRVTRTYLNLPCLMVKPRNFQVFWNNTILCILKGEMPFKMHKIIFQEKKIKKKRCVPTLLKIFRPVTRNTLSFSFGLSK